jgi:hypothetical protein
MFDRDYQLKGKHATYAKYLRDTARVFKRHIDVYMIGAIMGFLHGRQLPEDNTSKDDVMMFADVFIRENAKCEFIYRMLMLLDETTSLTLDQRANRAFRDDTDEQAMVNNMELFNSYVRGGIEYLYNKFYEDCVTQDDYINKVYEVVDRFKNDIEGKSYEDLIKNIVANG